MAKRAFVIMKYRSRFHGVVHTYAHEVCFDRKTANARCKELNAKAQSYIYEVATLPIHDPAGEQS